MAFFTRPSPRRFAGAWFLETHVTRSSDPAPRATPCGSSHQSRCPNSSRPQKGDRLEALYVLAVATGLRQGELLGLQWEDADLAGAALHVRHTLHELNGRLWIGEPKTTRARRQVDLPAVAVAALRDHREGMTTEGRPD